MKEIFYIFFKRDQYFDNFALDNYDHMLIDAQYKLIIYIYVVYRNIIFFDE